MTMKANFIFLGVVLAAMVATCVATAEYGGLPGVALIGVWMTLFILVDGGRSAA